MHGLHFSHCGLADGRVFGGVPQGEFLHQIRTLQDDAAARVLGGGFTEVFQEC